MTDATSAARMIPLWDRVVRASHWLLVCSVLGAWLTRHAPGPWHERLGYASLAIVAVRVVWGWCGSHYARFVNFVRGRRATLNYAVEWVETLHGKLADALLVLVGLRLDHSHRDEVFRNFIRTSFDYHGEAYHTSGMRVTYEPASDWSLSLLVTNLTNEQPILTAEERRPRAPIPNRYGRYQTLTPRTVSLEFNKQF